MIIKNNSKLDYETIGKVIDNFYVEAFKKIKDITPGKKYTLTFQVGYAFEYLLTIQFLKNDTKFIFDYIRDVPEKEQPKNKNKIDYKTKALAKTSQKLVEETKAKIKKAEEKNKKEHEK